MNTDVKKGFLKSFTCMCSQSAYKLSASTGVDMKGHKQQIKCALQQLFLTMLGCSENQCMLCCAQEGGDSVVELLQLITRTGQGLSPQTATVHADAIWAFSLKVFAFRQETPAGITAVRPVEDAAIALILALTLKLTEPTFKPLFLRLVDWAAQLPPSGK